MTLPVPARVLFEIVDEDIDHAAKAIRSRVFSAYRDVPWTPEQRLMLQPLIRTELETLVQRILGALDNVGGAIPANTAGVVGYQIHSTHWDEDDGGDIRVDNMDYRDMWWEYLEEKSAGNP